MTKQEVLDLIRYFSPKFPKEALQEIQANRDEYIPDLLESLEYVYQNAEELYENYDEDNDYFLYLYAMHLLAEFREKRAFPYLIQLMRLPEELNDFIFNDTLTDGLPKMLLCTYDGENLQMLLDVIENPELFEWARLAAVSAYTLLHMEGHVSRDDFISYLRSLIYDKLSDEKSEIVITGITHSIADTRMIEMICDARFLYEADKVDLDMDGYYDDFIDLMFDEDTYKKKSPYIDNTIDEMEWWASFREDDSKNKSKKETDIVDEVSPKKAKSKPGRNDPCPCGSGKKYKKCCIDKDNVVTETDKDDDIFDPTVISEKSKYDLLEMYPKDSEIFNEMYEKEAIEIDKLVYKALHRRGIPMFAHLRKKDTGNEVAAKINSLTEALKLFSDKCESEGITSFAEYDEKYMIHYRSREWVSELIDMTDNDKSKKTAAVRESAMEILKKFDVI